MKIPGMKFLKWLGIIILLLIIIYFLGPRPAPPKYDTALPNIPDRPELLETYISKKESVHNIKPDNEAKIVWQNDSSKQVTEYSVVYLHGFSASQMEGDPVHREFAKRFNCNLYLARLEDHGIDTSEAMLNLTADRLWNSAKEAYEIGKKLGKKVILMGTSTGGTLALKLAAQYPDIAGLILLSPNIAINDPLAWVANNHWGLQIAQLVKGKYNDTKDTIGLNNKYWYSKYRMESVVQLQELLETTMKASLFEKITQPVLLLYYYKDEEHQDPQVKVSAMKRMFRELGTPDSLKKEVPVPNAQAHVIGSFIKSKDVKTVETACEKFGLEVLQLQ